jgi:hypothetical protein
MKIILIGFSKIKFMPYANFYLDNIDREKHEVHVVYWNKDLKGEDLSKYENVTWHEFRRYQEDDVAKYKKIGNFFSFRDFVCRILKKERFGFVIVMHTMPAILLQDILTTKFRNRFIFDYRDSTYERFDFFKNMIAKLVRGSKATFTSSDGFRVFFPKLCSDKIFTTHNLLMDSLKHRQVEKTCSDCIRISFWGMIREEKTEKEIIAKFSADPRFELHYYGRELDTVRRCKEYAKTLQASNVFFHGEYKPEERYQFAAHTDLIHNLYCSCNMLLAMSNKYYDGAIFGIPQLCMEKSFMGDRAKTAGIGWTFDPWDPDFTEKVYQYYTNINRRKMLASCDVELDSILDEYHEAVHMIQQSLQCEQ